MFFSNDKMEIEDLTYDIELDQAGKIAVITPVVKIKSHCNQVLIFSLLVDNHELLPAAKIILTQGNNCLRLKYVKIINPLIKTASDQPGEKQYKMTMIIHFSSEACLPFEQYIEIFRK